VVKDRWRGYQTRAQYHRVKQDAVKTERETQEKMAKMEEGERQMHGELSKLRDRVELVESENLKKDAKITTMTQNIEEMELQL
jgi:predicted transcriptional regulator